MNDRWIRPDGARWNAADRVRVSRLFRGHIDTPSNRRRGKSCRIQRRTCFWHPDVEAEAHHIDYAKPFVVVWAGLKCGCHRKIDHGTLKIPRKAIFDYTSLIEGEYGVARLKIRVEESKSTACSCGRRPRWMVTEGKHRPECSKNCPEPAATGSNDAVPF